MCLCVCIHALHTDSFSHRIKNVLASVWVINIIVLGFCGRFNGGTQSFREFSISRCQFINLEKVWLNPSAPPPPLSTSLLNISTNWRMTSILKQHNGEAVRVMSAFLKRCSKRYFFSQLPQDEDDVCLFELIEITQSPRFLDKNRWFQGSLFQIGHLLAMSWVYAFSNLSAH